MCRSYILTLSKFNQALCDGIGLSYYCVNSNIFICTFCFKLYVRDTLTLDNDDDELILNDQRGRTEAEVGG